MRAIVAKDWQEHRLGLSILLTLLLAYAGVNAFFAETVGDVSALSRYRVTLVLAALLAAYLVNDQLITREHREQTQLFLEALPIGRGTLVSAKLFFGLALVLGTIVATLMLTLGIGVSQAPLNVAALPSVLLRALTFGACAHALLFATSFLGRYRIPLLLTALLVVMLVDTQTELDLSTFGPIALVDSTFGLESERYPIGDLAVTLLVSIACWGVGVTLFLVREGSVPALLAQRMSHREKVFVALLLLGGTIAMFVLDEKYDRQPFSLPGATVIAQDGVTVEIHTVGASVDAESQAKDLHQRLVAARRALRLDELPPLFLVPRQDLDPGQFESGEIRKADGALVRFHPSAEPRRRAQLLAFSLLQLLNVRSRGRVSLERNRWVVDGFALHFARSSYSEIPHRDLWLRASYALGRGFERRDLEGWLSFRERVGEDVADGLAWSLIEDLASIHGDERTMAFVRRMLVFEAPRDVRALLSTPNVTEAFEAELPERFDTFFDAWSERIRARATDAHRALSTIPAIEGELVTESLSEHTRRVRYRLFGATTSTLGSARVELRYLRLPVFDVEIDPRKVVTEDVSWAQATAFGVLPETYRRGERLAWTFATHADVLGCSVISGWRREALP